MNRAGLSLGCGCRSERSTWIAACGLASKRSSFILLACILLLGAACGQRPVVEPVVADISPDASCALDGMLLAVHDGPKSQLLRADGRRGYFCDTREIFGELLDPVRRRQVIGVWFQTLDAHPWEAHADGWAAPDSVVFVVGSRRMGAMGPTLAPFVAMAAAEQFVAAHGGRILRLDDVDHALLEQLQHQGMAQLE